MATIRTLSFLPEIYRTKKNAEILSGTLDNIVSEPTYSRIQGYIGSKFGNGIDASASYIPEVNKERTDYQLTPSVISLDDDTKNVSDFITYPGMVNELTNRGSITNNNASLFEGNTSSWDSFTDLDKLVNYHQYYWLPDGLPSVDITGNSATSVLNYQVTSDVSTYSIEEINATSTNFNPSITLVRGKTYTFAVNQNSQFWIQTEPGLLGKSTLNPAISTREIYGVTNNGSESGTITFTVPYENAQETFEFSTRYLVDITSDKLATSIIGNHLYDLVDPVTGNIIPGVNNIDGITDLDGKIIFFPDTELPSSAGSHTYTDGVVVYQMPYFSSTDFGYFYKIVYEEDPNNTGNPILTLQRLEAIPFNASIVAKYGLTNINVPYYQVSSLVFAKVPNLTARLTKLYYQDSEVSTKTGIFNIVDDTASVIIDINDILGKKTYTSPNNIVFTNGLKIKFDSYVHPSSYANIEYYVDGVGSSINLIPVLNLVCPESFSESEYNTFDNFPFDADTFDVSMYIPVEPDYITIARSAINENAWSRSNRWFHTDVISAAGTYNNSDYLTTYATSNAKAKRPIVEFYPNLKMFNSGTTSVPFVDFYDSTTTDAFSNVAGKLSYYADIDAYVPVSTIAGTVTSPVNSSSLVAGQAYQISSLGNTNWNLVVGTSNIIYYVGDTIVCKNAVSGTGTATFLATSTTATLNSNNATGTFSAGMFVATEDATLLPAGSYIFSATTDDSGITTLVIHWDDPQNILGGNAALIATNNSMDNYQLFSGARIIFSNDVDETVRNNIYTVNITQVEENEAPVIVLSLADQGEPILGTQTVILRGESFKGKSIYFDGISWNLAQQKITINQPPLFDVLDKNENSLSDASIYASSSFTGTKLFSYSIGTGAPDSVLGFPISYSSTNNIGDIAFTVDFNSDIFNYVNGANVVTENINTGYVYQYSTPSSFNRLLGWTASVAPVPQYQIFNFVYDSSTPVLKCDIEKSTNTIWPSIKVFYNNAYVNNDKYSVITDANSTEVTLITPPSDGTPVEVLLLSDQVSANGYYDIPTNLNNNPLNNSLEKVNLDEIRLQFNDIFINNGTITGSINGANSYRDSGNPIGYGTKLIQNQCPVVTPGLFLRDSSLNLQEALLFNSREYVKYKQLLTFTVQNSNYDVTYSPADILDDAIEQISLARTESNSFYWTDMLPSRVPYISKTYTFRNNTNNVALSLSKIYDFSVASYDSVLVYLIRVVNGKKNVIQLQKNVDYTVSSTATNVIITKQLLQNDIITVNEYNQTYASYVPHTPSKLGLYPLFVPEIILDNNLVTPTYFIKGHDGSYTKLYGSYDANTESLNDFRDIALFEFENRIYNNTKLSSTVPVIDLTEIKPGYFRDVPTFSDWLSVYTANFMNWAGQNRIDYTSHYFDKNNPFTFNYRNSSEKLTNTANNIGNWAGLYQYFYDTFTPHLTPWEMLGFSIKPSWWDARYGAAPYTSGNTILWNDLQLGFVWNDGDSYTKEKYARDRLAEIIPVDAAGNLLDPMTVLVGNYDANIFQADWIIGDTGPAELSYRRSSSYPFDIINAYSLLKPAKFYNLAIDLDVYQYNTEFGQWLTNGRNSLTLSDIKVYGSGIAKTSYLNWIVDYQKQHGIDASSYISNKLSNVDVRLTYRLAGFSDQTLLNFSLEKVSPNDNNTALKIPNENYNIILYNNQPHDQLTMSSVIIQKTGNNWAVYGNSQSSAYFVIDSPVINGKTIAVEYGSATVKVAQDYSQTKQYIPYGTIFYSTQEIAQFIKSYSSSLETKGVILDQTFNGSPINWDTMIQEFLYWSQTGWESGSAITLNPASTTLKITPPMGIVQPLTNSADNFILNQNLYPIKSKDLDVYRQDNSFTVSTLNPGDSMSYTQLDYASLEHGIVFDNTTMFNDVIYDLTTGLRQYRIMLSGRKTAEWNGTLTTNGFFLSQDNIVAWSTGTKYYAGNIVTYKNKYWAAQQTVEAASNFDTSVWKIVKTESIRYGMLPNSANRAYESTLFYDVDRSNLASDNDLLSMSLIGYRPRDYLALADLTTAAQLNVYKNFIKNKGTPNSLEVFNTVNLAQGELKYDIHENWAIKTSQFGDKNSGKYIEMQLDETQITGNASIISVTNGDVPAGTSQIVPINKLYNYNFNVLSPNILPLMESQDQQTAGYVSFDDVNVFSYNFSGLDNATDSTGNLLDINNLYTGDYIWVANFNGSWGVYSTVIQGTITSITYGSSYSTVTFSDPHELSVNDPIAVIQTTDDINGYYQVNTVVDSKTITIPYANALNSGKTIELLGFVLKLENKRYSTISSLPDIVNVFDKNDIYWIDEDSNGRWAVYQKTSNKYSLVDTISTLSGNNKAIVSEELGILITNGNNVDRYSMVGTDYLLTETINGGAGFGSSIATSDRTIFIANSITQQINVYYNNDTVLSSNSVLINTIDLACDKIWISEDGNYLYASDTSTNSINVIKKINYDISAEFMTAGRAYIIQTLGDSDWVSVGAIENSPNVVFVASGPITPSTGVAKEISYELGFTISGSETGFGTDFASSSTGHTIVVGSPDKIINSLQGVGGAYIYVQDAQTTKTSYQNNNNPEQIGIVFSNNAVIANAFTTVTGSNIYFSVPAGLKINDRVVFGGAYIENYGFNTSAVYYVQSVSPTYITVKSTISSNTPVLFDSITGISGQCYIQDNTVDVFVNGTVVTTDNYFIKNSTLTYIGNFSAGDIIAIVFSSYTLTQTLAGNNTTRIDSHYGSSVTIDRSGNEIFVSSPYEVSTSSEGSVYRYTNTAGISGTILGSNICNVTISGTVTINGYPIVIPIGNSVVASSVINNSKIPNIVASSVDGKVMISVINDSETIALQKIIINAPESLLTQLGILLRTNTQVIRSSDTYAKTGFGYSLAITDNELFVSSINSVCESQVTFDTVYKNDHTNTVFDNQTTLFYDVSPATGLVETFNLIEGPNYTRQYVYGQSLSVDDDDINFGNNLSIAGNNLVISSENATFNVNVFYGTEENWSVLRQESVTVDINSIDGINLYSKTNSVSLVNLDYIDPLNGKILGVARENIEFMSTVDPAKYNSVSSGITSVWGAEFVGMCWFDMSNTKWIDYNQTDITYNIKYFGKVFPGSDPAVYTWINSAYPPALYSGTGTVYDISKYCSKSTLDNSGNIITTYYFWVRNTNTITQNHTLADTVIENYIKNPAASGVAYCALLTPSSYALYNAVPYINGTDTIMHLGFSTGSDLEGNIHTEYSLIRENYEDDFLYGIPENTNTNLLPNHDLYPTSGEKTPYGLYLKLLDSFSGSNTFGNPVPDPFLPMPIQSGISIRPSQSMFMDRLSALENFVTYINNILASYPITETRTNITLLQTTGTYFNTNDYWSYENWWVEGFDNNTKPTRQVSVYADLNMLSVNAGTLVKVNDNGFGKFEIYQYTGDAWNRIGLESGTIQLSSNLYDYIDYNIGFDGSFFDTDSFDFCPSEETRYVIRGVFEQLLVDDLLSYRNPALIMLFEYIQSEEPAYGTNIDWLKKTSLVDISHDVRQLTQQNVYKSDNETFLEGFINEVKPYRVLIKDYLFTYSGIDEANIYATDFDLPASIMGSEFVTPMLTDTPNASNEFLPSDNIWNQNIYTDWFKYKGLSLAQENNYRIAYLSSYIDTSTREIEVDNSYVFPESGTITINGEILGYSGVNRALNLLTGIIRGVNNTTISTHFPGAEIFMDIPEIIMLNSGNNYASTPNVTAFIDTTIYPEPEIEMELEAIMSNGSVISINVLNPGQGYFTVPEIMIDPSYIIYFDDNSIDTALYTLNLYAPNLTTGDIIQFSGNNSSVPENIVNGAWYYVNVLETTPNTIIALYKTYRDSINDRARIKIGISGTTNTMALNAGARAVAVTTPNPVRDIKINLKFDRTTYRNRVLDWNEGVYYGSYFAGTLYDSSRISSSSYTLQNVYPNIDTILASNHGATFEIVNVENIEQTEWSTIVRTVTSVINNVITITPPSVLQNSFDSTVGFMVNSPIKFGSNISGLIENQTYYVNSVLNTYQFTVSDTVSGNVLSIPDQTVNSTAIPGIVADQGRITVNYKGIVTITGTEKTTNKLFTELSVAGTQGTTNFYKGAPIFFVENVFGNIVENQVYYVNTIVDNETFTVNKVDNFITTVVTATDGSNNTIIVGDSTDFIINDPIMIVGDLAGTNIVSGKLYYINEIVDINHVKISLLTNNEPVVLNTVADVLATMDNQKNTVPLTTTTGSMIANMSLPVSPGQIDGQLFSFYKTSGFKSGLTSSTYSNLLTGTISATNGSTNRIYVGSIDTTTYYENMPIEVFATANGLSVNTPYYITNIGKVSLTVTSTNGTILTCNSTTELYSGMKIIFSGNSLGTLILGQEYYVVDVLSPTTFTITNVKGSPAITLTASTGAMLGGGDNYFELSLSPGGSNVALTTGVTSIQYTQYITSYPTIDISYRLGGYTALIANSGSGFSINNTIVFSGSAVGGSSPQNDITLKVNTVDTLGQITSVIVTGTPPALSENFYLKVVSDTELDIFSDKELKSSVPASNLNYTGYTMTSVSRLTAPYSLTLGSTSGFYVGDSVYITGDNTGTFVAGKEYFVYSITSDTNMILSTLPGDNTTIVPVTDNNVTLTIAKPGDFIFLSEPFYFTQSIVKYNNRLYECVVSNHDTEFVLGKWNEINANDIRLNALDRTFVYYDPTVNMPGTDLTQLIDGLVYPNPVYMGNYFALDQQYDVDTHVVDNDPNASYTIQGNDFSYSYGPEELMPGKIQDNISVISSTLPGTNWDVVTYGHTGFDITNLEITPSGSTQTIFSFKNESQTVSGITVQEIDGTTGLATTMPISSYSIDWVNKEIILATPLPYYPIINRLQIELFETGNGYQLAKSDTDDAPIITNTNTGFNEINLACNYNEALISGNGVLKYDSTLITEAVTETVAATNRLICTDVSLFTIGKAITFEGGLFGGIVANQPYYVKTINPASNTITISDSFDSSTGTVGPVLSVTDDSGSMIAIIQNGNGLVWTDPYVLHNGTKLVVGVTDKISAINNNALQTISTENMAVGNEITFDTSAFGGLIPFKNYYIISINSATSFSISETLGGPTVVLTNSSGGSTFITNDYAFDVQTDGTTAKIIFAETGLTQENDYISFTVFGESLPDQYGYSIPEIQNFKGNGSTTYQLTNFVEYENPDHAIVEVNGLRVMPNTFTINGELNNIVFNSAKTNADEINVMSFNDTNRQYLTTSDVLTGKSVVNIVNVNTSVSDYTVRGWVTSSNSSNNQLTAVSPGGTTGMISGQSISFYGTSFGGVNTTDKVYYVGTVVSSSNFTIVDNTGTVVTLTTATGYMDFTVGGMETTRITTGAPHNFTTNEKVRMYGIEGSIELNNNIYYARYITPTVFDIYTAPFTQTLSGSNSPVTSASSYTGSGYASSLGQYRIITTESTSINSNLIVCTSVDRMIQGNPVYFSAAGYQDGDTIVSGIVQGQKYYVGTIDPNAFGFSISTTQFGPDIVLTNSVQNMNVTLWNQLNPDRVWVYLNGKRVPSSKITISDVNEISINNVIISSDQIIITSMIPTATPHEQKFMNIIDSSGTQTIFNMNSPFRTWLTHDLSATDTELFVNDVSKLTVTKIQTNVVTFDTDGYYVGLNADKNKITSISVFNVTSQQTIDTEHYVSLISGMSPEIRIEQGAWIKPGDTVEITILEGNLIYVAGEQIMFSDINAETNSISGLVRGVNGTGTVPMINVNETVYCLLDVNQMNENYNNVIWNSYEYSALGDPLQISNTVPAQFLNTEF